MDEEKENNSVNKGIKLVGVSAVTPHNRALYEAGKTILIDSINTSRDFCKFMISLSASAIPIYLGLLKFVLPEHFTPTLEQCILSILPAVLFLSASVVFTIGYYPQVSSFSLDVVNEIERVRTNTIQRRTRLIWVGFSIFMISTLGAIASLVLSLWID